MGIVSWCNGSTAVFGSACPGSNPGETTIQLSGGGTSRRIGGDKRGSGSVGRALASQAEGRGFEPRLPLQFTNEAV